MSEHASGSRKRKANGDIASGNYDSLSSEESKESISRTTVFDLNDDCLSLVMDYLEIKDQLRLASSNVYFEVKFETYAIHRYRVMYESLMNGVDIEDQKKLLQIVGEHVVSYVSCDPISNVGQQLWLLKNYCKNLKKLKMSFHRERGGWNDLFNLKKLKSLDARLYFGDYKCTDFFYDLRQITCLRKLKLECYPSYSGVGLNLLHQLEYLDVRGIHGEILGDCFQKMTRLRQLKLDRIKNMSKNDFEILAKNCQQLERLRIGKNTLDPTVPYELVCQLPRLKHLQLFLDGSVRDSFIKGLIHKEGVPLKKLILDKGALSEEQIRYLCKISTLQQLCIN